MDFVTVENVSKEFVVHTGLIKQLTGNVKTVKAVSSISFSVQAGEIVGLVGESGCGKTTLGNLLIKLEDSTQGNIYIDGVDITNIRSRKEIVEFRKKMQFIFQDPFDSLNPKMTIRQILEEPLRHMKLAASPGEMDKKVVDILEGVELSPAANYIDRFPHRLSGGQRQRIAIARGLIVNPAFIVADEPVSMLDVSIRAGVLNLLQKLNKERGVGILLITHDLATARFLCNRIMVMYLGKIMEITDPNTLVENPLHPYSQLLISSAPDLFAGKKERMDDRGDIASAMAMATGCSFAPRCPQATDICRDKAPPLREIEVGRSVACFMVEPKKNCNTEK